jgi:N-acyl-phosphatidylethanolamine-hydrolysing phospholipase D
MAEWMRANTGVAEGRVKELVWWQEAALAGEGGTSFTVALTPANHWCKRGVSDDNMVLWGSWTVMGPNKRFWFAGDTGYCEAFAQIGKQYGPFDMAAIPIGNYQPNWFMRYQHVHPGEAVQVHQDVRSRKSLGIHWGTFKQLSTENYLEPPVLLTSFMNQAGLDPDTFVTTDIGGSVKG